MSNCITYGSPISMLLLMNEINNKNIFSKNKKCYTYYEDSYIGNSKWYDYVKLCFLNKIIGEFVESHSILSH